jgi:hypothetical protein
MESAYIATVGSAENGLRGCPGLLSLSDVRRLRIVSAKRRLHAAWAWYEGNGYAA